MVDVRQFSRLGEADAERIHREVDASRRDTNADPEKGHSQDSAARSQLNWR